MTADTSLTVTGKPTQPPSGPRARAWTIAAVFYWFLLPIAVYYQRKARREAADSGGLYVWPRHLGNRPILLWLPAMAVSLGLVALMASTGIYGP